ncbi:hypothetical protein HBF26_17270 [Luteibacter jiangsuensis]|uniref:Mu-like prophage FluMu N-terminal domain-containing protein n=1 Tax=Luteibacter jiangsuensis TaxID=637577 RepID=A0ABX0Q813_9GAMM|nr:hypothetical protein [Luteibacter jiangsuensis]NID06649.1 hypothetical protein [Luteibacter jiangsuensis]
MQIKFIPPDPRAGMIATMDSSLGELFVRKGNAVRVSEQHVDAASVPPAPAPAEPAGETDLDEEEQEQDTKPARDLPTLAAAFVDGTVPDVTARIEGADEELLKAALATETASEKPRKGVVDALTSALTPQA